MLLLLHRYRKSIVNFTIECIISNVHFWGKTFPNRVNWNSANTYCRGEGMTLVSFDTQQEDQIISDHIKGVSNPGEN
jgi:hypothetical protein